MLVLNYLEFVAVEYLVFNDILPTQLMVAANFTLPDDMIFGQAQVIAITAYRWTETKLFSSQN